MFPAPRLPLAALVVAVAAALSGLAGASAWTVLIAGNLALVVLLGLDVAMAPDPRSLRLDRDLPEVLRVGRSSTLALRLHNPSTRTARLALRDATPPSMRRAPARERAVLRPGEWAVLGSRVTPARRGRLVVGPPTVRATGPLGLGGRQATLPSTREVRIYPALPSRAEVELRLERARLLQVGERSSSIRGGGTDFDSLREYHRDDEFRRINWRATARATKPIANQYREERNQQVLILLDASRTMAGTVASVSRLEHAIDAAVAVAELAARVGDHVGLTAFGAGVRAVVPPRGGRAQTRRILEAVFDVEPALEAASYGAAFAETLARSRRRSLLVLLTELTDEAVVEPLAAAVPALLARHLVVIGTVADPEVGRLAGAVPTSSEEAYLKAAASAAVEARERASARLRRMGAVVIDRPPGALAGHLADHYLRVKALGRL